MIEKKANCIREEGTGTGKSLARNSYRELP